jgi:hypothetical protein
MGSYVTKIIRFQSTTKNGESPLPPALWHFWPEMGGNFKRYPRIPEFCMGSLMILSFKHQSAVIWSPINLTVVKYVLSKIKVLIVYKRKKEHSFYIFLPFFLHNQTLTIALKPTSERLEATRPANKAKGTCYLHVSLFTFYQEPKISTSISPIYFRGQSL